MKFGLPISFSFHFFAVCGGMLLWHNTVEDLPAVRIIPLKLVTVAERTNIAPTRKKPIKETPKEDVPVLAKPEPVEKPAPAPIPTPAIETPTEEAKPDKPTPKEPGKTPAFNLDALSDMVSKARTDTPDANVQKPLVGEVRMADRDQRGVGDQTENTVSAPDYIKTKMKPCWPIDRGAKNYQKLRVEVRLLLGENGDINSLNVINGAQIIASQNSAWRAARDKVLAGLHECAPYDGLRAQDYEQWKNMKLNFQPGEVQ